jgi:ribosomal protein L4
VDVRDVGQLDPVSLAGFQQVLITGAALKRLEDRLT